MMGAMFIAGLSFFMVHGWIQIHVSEILPDARGAAISLHAFFLFLGLRRGRWLTVLPFSHFGRHADYDCERGVVSCDGARHRGGAGETSDRGCEMIASRCKSSCSPLPSSA